MKKVGVIFGGVTCEHEVSIVTGLQLIENIDKKKYEIVPIYIHSDGEWYVGDKLLNSMIYKDFDSYKGGIDKGYIPPTKPGIVIPARGLLAKETFIKLDVVIPAMHGMNGEDGSLQGLLELANIPYTSSGVLGASIGMDKILMKKVFEANLIPVLPYTYFLRDEWEASRDVVIAQIEAVLKYPMFVKPANLGSSIGISKAIDKETLIAAIEVAVCYDERIIVENGVEQISEVNCSAIGRGSKVSVSVCEQPVSWKEFLTFDEKYLRGTKGPAVKTGGAKSAGMATMSRKVPAEITPEQTAEVKELTAKAFKALNSKGVVRIDFIIDNADGKVYVNEINTIPGSFAFYLWDFEGIKYPQLIDKIIELAEEEHAEKNKNNYTYKSDIISHASGALKTGGAKN
ncbi:MAG: D-alanine--D-alanine ligase [Clostridia bacterium]|nr:D-alanine--D-alanine ligase [Clostridia bacterium]